ncbi:serine/threonine protein kinase, partial [Streptomyces sp. T-3]|nr:serine/threonine protein kinase [Streptomyces sp. T-3]
AGPPRRLGRLLLVLILLGLVAAIAYAMMFMPKAEPKGKDEGGRTGQAGSASSAPAAQPPTDKPSPEKSKESAPASSSKPDPQSSGPDLAKGFVLRKDLEGFQLAVASGWDRQGKNGRGQVTYSGGKFDLIVVPGRDTVEATTGDPLEYQRENERELQPFRDSSWATSSGMRQVSVGDRISAEGQFTWFEGDDEVFVRNSAMLIDGRYHVVMVKGPESERDEVTRLFEQAVATYQPKI